MQSADVYAKCVKIEPSASRRTHGVLPLWPFVEPDDNLHGPVNSARDHYIRIAEEELGGAGGVGNSDLMADQLRVEHLIATRGSYTDRQRDGAGASLGSGDDPASRNYVDGAAALVELAGARGVGNQRLIDKAVRVVLPAALIGPEIGSTVSQQRLRAIGPKFALPDLLGAGLGI